VTATLTEVREALAGTLAAAIPDVNFEARPVDTVSVPAGIVQGFAQTDADFSSHRTVTTSVLVLVARSNVDQIDLLDQLIDHGDGSILAALDADPTLGGVVGYCVWKATGDYGDYELGGVPYYGTVVTLEVMP
jgi:hypothetical protein